MKKILIFFYNLLLFFLLVPAIILLLLRYKQRFLKEFSFNLSERFGKWDFDVSKSGLNKPLLWFHCASIGEVRALEPILKKLSQYNKLITTITPEAYSYVNENKISDFVFLAPVDFSFVVQRVINLIKPAGLIIFETEFWPGLLWTAKKNNIKIIIINARISHRSFPYYMAFRFFWKRCLMNIDCILARSNEDAERFNALGYPIERLIVSGNIKYDKPASLFNFSKEKINLQESDLLFVAGSTRTGEEQILLDVWSAIKERHKNFKIIIAPRHLNRLPDIIRLLQKSGVQFCLFSSLQKFNKWECLLIDKFGELQKFYSIADITFAGGSLVNKGGQNPIEPASYSKPVLFGTYMYNFSSEAKLLEENGGGIKIRNSAEFISQMEKLISNKSYRDETGKKALQTVETQKGAMKKTLELLVKI